MLSIISVAAWPLKRKTEPSTRITLFLRSLLPVCFLFVSVFGNISSPTLNLTDLQPKGRVHLHVEYEPKGIQPATNDVVFLESFARYGFFKGITKSG